MTLRPSSVSAATGMTSTSASGAHDRSRSRPSRSRTTTTAAGSPRPGSPASRTASPAVVPAATRIGAAGAGLTAALIGVSPLRRGLVGVGRTRPCYRCGSSGPQANRAVQPVPIEAEEFGGPVGRAEQPQGAHDDQRCEDAAEDLDRTNVGRGTSPSPCRSAPWRRPAAVAPIRTRSPESRARRTRLPSPDPDTGSR